MSQHYRSILQLSGGGTPFANTYSMSLDGIDEYLISNIDGRSTGGVLASLDTDVEMTFSLWFKVPSLPASLKGIFQWGIQLNDSIPFLLLQLQPTGNIRILVDNGYRLTQSISTGIWYNIVITRTANNNTWTFYLNGSSVGTYDDGGTITNRFRALSIYLGNGYNGYFNGNIDEVAIWNTDQSSNVSTIYNSGTPTDLTSLSPLSWWRMGDGDTWNGSSWTLTDNGSGGNNATSVNMEEADRLPISPNSYTQNSFSFDGVDEYFTAGNPASLQITGALTLSAWVKRDSTATSNNYQIIGKDNVFSARCYSLGINTATNQARFNIWRLNIEKNVIGTTVLSSDVWYHIMAVNDGTDLKIYVNGVLDGINVGGGGTIDNDATNFNIGSRDAGVNSGYWNGKIDEVAVWNTDQSSNISTIFNNGIPQDISSLSPLSHWRVGENATWNGSTWTLTDQGSGGNDATSVNMEEADKTGDQPYVI